MHLEVKTTVRRAASAHDARVHAARAAAWRPAEPGLDPAHAQQLRRRSHAGAAGLARSAPSRAATARRSTTRWRPRAGRTTTPSSTRPSGPSATSRVPIDVDDRFPAITLDRLTQVVPNLKVVSRPVLPGGRHPLPNHTLPGRPRRSRRSPGDLPHERRCSRPVAAAEEPAVGLAEQAPRPLLPACELFAGQPVVGGGSGGLRRCRTTERPGHDPAAPRAREVGRER